MAPLLEFLSSNLFHYEVDFFLDKLIKTRISLENENCFKMSEEQSQDSLRDNIHFGYDDFCQD